MKSQTKTHTRIFARSGAPPLLAFAEYPAKLGMKVQGSRASLPYRHMTEQFVLLN